MFKSSIVDVSTVKVLDKYIDSKEQYFLITDKFNFSYKEKTYNIHFIISNKIQKGKQIVDTNVTMTDFKKIYNINCCEYVEIVNYQDYITETNRNYVPKVSLPVYDFLLLFCDYFIKNLDKATNFDHFSKYIDKVNEKDIIFFDNPISVNAQSTINRIGYGNEYYYDTLMYEGTLYGETSQFPVVGYIINYDQFLTQIRYSRYDK